MADKPLAKTAASFKALRGACTRDAGANAYSLQRALHFQLPFTSFWAKHRTAGAFPATPNVGSCPLMHCPIL